MKDNTKQELLRYKEHGIPTGDFLYAVLTNNLLAAFGCADEQNAMDMREIAMFVYDELPSISHGTRERVGNWIRNKGLVGLEKKSGIFITPEATCNY
jgi:hypothetical protein